LFGRAFKLKNKVFDSCIYISAPGKNEEDVGVGPSGCGVRPVARGVKRVSPLNFLWPLQNFLLSRWCYEAVFKMIILEK
jgi:hypothetical protein